MENYRNTGKSFRAIQFNRLNFEELWAFTNGNVEGLTIEGEEPGKAYCNLKSYYGNIKIIEGDYVFSDLENKNFFAFPPEYFSTINERVARNFEPPVEK